MVNKVKGMYVTKSDKGRIRNNNEDIARVFVSKDEKAVLLLVCDGIGGHSYGDYAAKLAADGFEDAFRNHVFIPNTWFTQIWLNQTIRHINERINRKANKNEMYKDMGTTFVLALIYNNQVYVYNAGDSRAYFVLFKQLKMLSEDQSYVAYLERTGKIDDYDEDHIPNKNAITSALGIYPSISFNSFVYPYSGESILLCSDGLYNNLTEEEIHNILLEHISIERKADKLIDEANDHGGSDNITVAYWESKHD